MALPDRQEGLFKPQRPDYEREFRRQGLRLTLPSRFRDPLILPSTFKTNELTGLPIEDESTSPYIARLISDAIRNGKKWVVGLTDADNLKYVNDILEDRGLGDIVIQYGSTRLTQAAEQALAPHRKIRRGVEVVALRDGDQADETVVVMTGVNDAEIARFREAINKTAIPFPVRTGQPGYETFELSVSAGMVSYDDIRLEDALQKESGWIESGETSPRLYAFIKELAKKDIKLQKAIKDLGRFKLEELLSLPNIAELVQYQTGEFRGRRNSEELTAMGYKFMALAVLRQLSRNETIGEEFKLLLPRLGLSPADLENISRETLDTIFEEFFAHRRQRQPEENS